MSHLQGQATGFGSQYKGCCIFFLLFFVLLLTFLKNTMAWDFSKDLEVLHSEYLGTDFSC